MLIKILSILALIALFFIISQSADLIVLHLRQLGEKLGVKVFFLGLVLGIMTSLPEMAIGINSIISDIPSISFGNMVGGNIVLFGLVLAISIILHRKIKTKKETYPFLIVLLFLFFPLLLGLKGSLNFFDGLIIILAYVLLIIFLFHKNKENNNTKVKIIKRKSTQKHFFFILIGVIGLIISSELIAQTTKFILKDYNISLFVFGLILYSIGTNLPELIIALRSFKRKMGDLSFSNLLGSAMSNSLMLGILSTMKTINIEIDLAYWFLIIFTFIFFIILYIFYKTDQFLSRKEGIFLLVMYLIFLSGQIFIQIKY